MPKLYLNNSQVKNGKVYTDLIFDSHRQLNKPNTTIDINDLGDKSINLGDAYNQSQLGAKPYEICPKK